MLDPKGRSFRSRQLEVGDSSSDVSTLRFDPWTMCVHFGRKNSKEQYSTSHAPRSTPRHSQMRQHVSKRLGASADNESITATSPREGGPSGGKKRHASKKGKTAAIAVTAAFTISIPGEGILDDGDSLDVISQLSGIELLHACERLENHNVTLRQRLAKLELQTMQKEHGGNEDELNKTDSRLPRVCPRLTSCIYPTDEPSPQRGALHQQTPQRKDPMPSPTPGN